MQLRAGSYPIKQLLDLIDINVKPLSPSQIVTIRACKRGVYIWVMEFTFLVGNSMHYNESLHRIVTHSTWTNDVTKDAPSLVQMRWEKDMAFTNVFEFKPVERRECGANRKLKCAPKLYTGIYRADRTEKVI